VGAANLARADRPIATPFVLGTGKRLFGDGTIAAGLRLSDSKLADTASSSRHNERAGDIDHGRFALEERAEAEVGSRRQADA
jgi:hypothetical protein